MILFRTVDREFLCKRRKRCTDSAAQIRRLLMCPCRFLVLVEFLGERYLYGSFCPEFSFFTSPLLVNMWQYLVGWAHSNFTLSNLHKRSPLMVSVALSYTNSYVNISTYINPLILSHPLGLSDSASWFTGTSPVIFCTCSYVQKSYPLQEPEAPGYRSRHILYSFLCIVSPAIFPYFDFCCTLIY